MDFMTIPNRRGLLNIITILLAVGLSACKQDLTDDAIPFIPFPDEVISLNLPEYAALKLDGGVYLSDAGVRGIIVYRKNATTYLAYERNCSYHPNDACATVDVHASNLFMIDSCCGSSFDFDDGQPTGGPAWRPLRRYRSFVDGAQLTIVAESLNGM
jgi:nitrite reductase/ring-hydroxylating ferredoxin subunit